MQAPQFDEAELFSAMFRSGARYMLIGRRAMAALGLPVLTADYDIWLHIEDMEALNTALEPLSLFPSHPPDEARQQGRYVLENDEHIDVLVARVVPTVSGERVSFDKVWERRVELQYDSHTIISIPCIDDLIRTKRWASRDRDVADIRLLEALKAAREGER